MKKIFAKLGRWLVKVLTPAAIDAAQKEIDRQSDKPAP